MRNAWAIAKCVGALQFPSATYMHWGFQNSKNFDRKCITSDLSERFSDFKSIKKVIQQYFKLNRNVIEIILETLESYAQERHQFLQKNVRILKFF